MVKNFHKNYNEEVWFSSVATNKTNMTVAQISKQEEIQCHCAQKSKWLLGDRYYKYIVHEALCVCFLYETYKYKI